MSIRTRSDDGKHWNKSCAGEHCFFSSKNAALFERKMLLYTTLSMKLHHCTLSEIKTPVFTLSDVPACVLIRCVDQKQRSNLDFLTKSVNNTLQTSGDIAIESSCRRKIQAQA